MQLLSSSLLKLSSTLFVGLVLFVQSVQPVPITSDPTLNSPTESNQLRPGVSDIVTPSQIHARDPNLPIFVDFWVTAKEGRSAEIPISFFIALRDALDTMLDLVKPSIVKAINTHENQLLPDESTIQLDTLDVATSSLTNEITARCIFYGPHTRWIHPHTQQHLTWVARIEGESILNGPAAYRYEPRLLTGTLAVGGQVMLSVQKGRYQEGPWDKDKTGVLLPEKRETERHLTFEDSLPNRAVRFQN
ncbi:hypothetical protein DFH05DRAFT_540585 [Lentinula detonsa]|uniref:Uncharacterized protein n=1 Tax=Lentinula detonsa TaxID=2804962 RepID=A0A9W8NR65_9AGAR|nr:hypothetical protein DFH05DRAFT_540585 [Lentinula detonsa]